MDESTQDRIHFLTCNIPNARLFAQKDRREGSDDNVIVALDIRDDVAFDLASASQPPDELRKTLKRFEQAQMIPTAWMSLPREIAADSVAIGGNQFKIMACRAAEGHFWMVAISAGGNVSAEVPLK